jgi:transposase-like protein
VKSLQDKQQLFVQELANGSTVVAAAKRVGVTEQTAHNWKRKPEVKQALEAALVAVEQGRVKVIESIAAERTKASFPDVNSKLQKGGVDAIDFLVNLVNNPEARCRDRLDAARELVRLSGVVESQKIFIQSQTIEPDRRKKGLSEKTAAAIRRHILGIDEDAIEQEVV